MVRESSRRFGHDERSNVLNSRKICQACQCCCQSSSQVPHLPAHRPQAGSYLRLPVRRNGYLQVGQGMEVIELTPVFPGCNQQLFGGQGGGGGAHSASVTGLMAVDEGKESWWRVRGR